MNKKILIAYFSRAGDNYVGGSIFSGKTILPFCTHEGSGLGRSESDIQKLCPGADVRKGLAIRGSSVKGAKGDIERWLESHGL